MNITKNPKVTQSIILKSIATIVFFLLLFAAIVAMIGYRNFSAAILNQYTDGAFRLARASSNTIDADQLDTYLAEGGTSEEYRSIWHRLDNLCNGADVTFIYVIQPDLSDYNHITFIFSTVNKTSSYTPFDTGYVYATTNDEYKEKYRQLYSGEAEQALLVLNSRSYDRSVHHITAMVPLKGDDGLTKGILCVERPISTLTKVLQTYVRSIFFVVLALTIIISLSQGAYLGKVLLQPIKTIADEASRFARENTVSDTKLTEKIKSRDEVLVLANSIDTMEEQVQSYIADLTKATVEKERLGTELHMAARIQKSMMPCDFPAFPDRNEFDIFASVDPARGVGGDFYDFFMIDDNHLCIVMADVSGKGIPGALFMMISKVILQSCAMLGKSASEILTKTNEALCSKNKNEMFVTVWLGILEISTGIMTVANAGHEYPAMKRPDGSFELLRKKHDFVIGGIDGIQYKEHVLHFEPGAKLFLYTDGIPEATSSEGKMFGLNRMLEALNEAPDASPKEILQNVHRSVDAFVGDAEPFDDLTMLCLEYRGPKPDIECEPIEEFVVEL